MHIHAGFIYSKKFRLDGEVDGSPDMGVLGTLAEPVSFKVIAPSGGMIFLDSKLVIIDASVAWEKFGGQVALTNGLLIRVCDVGGTVLADFFDGDSVKANEDFSLVAETSSISREAGKDAFIVLWASANGGIQLQKGQYIEILIRDNLTGISGSMSAMLRAARLSL